MKKGISTVFQLQLIIPTMKVPIFFQGRTPVSPANTRYLQMNAYGLNSSSDPSDVSNTAQDSATMFGMTGALKNLYVWLSSDPGAAGSFTLTLMKNGTPSAITIIVPSGATGLPVLVSDLTHNVAVAATDLFSLECVNDTLSTSALSGAFVIEFDPS